MKKREQRKLSRALKKTFMNLSPETIKKSIYIIIDFAEESRISLEEAKEKIK